MTIKSFPRILISGSVMWHNKDCVFHRASGPAVEYMDGNKEWWFNGNLHRIDGPAIVRDSHEQWWKNGKQHRMNGPAVSYSAGYKEWWVDGKLIKYSND